MNIKFLAIVTPPPDIYHGCSTRWSFWEYRFTPVNMTSCERHNVSKHMEIKNSKKYIIFYISSKLSFLEKREFTSS